MPAEQYKALTKVNLPFIEQAYEPGQMIPLAAFEESAAQAAELIDDRTHKDPDATPVQTAEDTIAELLKWGSISEDPDAELHPDSIIPDPNALSLNALIYQAENMAKKLEEAGQPVPEQLTALLEADREVASHDTGNGRDRHV